jgi:hypothetical protein
MRDWSEEENAPLPEWLSEAIDPLMSDFQQPHPIPVTIGFDGLREDLWIRERDRGGAGFGLRGEGRGASLMVTLAHWLQEQFFWESRGAWGEPRPSCPGHTHPAYAAEIGGDAWWLCPRDHHAIARVGSLRS